MVEEGVEDVDLFKETLQGSKEGEELINNLHQGLDNPKDFVTFAMQLENQTTWLSPTACPGVEISPPTGRPLSRPV